jgi:hypothetical protein
MAQKIENPATLETCRARNTITTIGSDNSDPHAIRQDFRAIWIARRFAISPDMAILIAVLALGEARL